MAFLPYQLRQHNPIVWTIRTLSLSMIAQFVLSWKLWAPFGRQFPTISLLAWLPISLGTAADLLLSLLMILSLAGIIIRPYNRPGIYLFLAAATLLVLEDVIRLQPWLYIFGLMLLAVAIYGRERRDRLAGVIMTITSATYLWSGLQKLNHAFGVEILPWLAGGLGLESIVKSTPGLAYGVAALEASVGIGLLVPPLRKPAAVAGMLIHLFLLAALGPWALNWNLVIWPWNVAMMVILWLLAFRSTTGVTIKDQARERFGDILRPSLSSPFFWVVVLLTLLLPALNYVRLWDSHLSGSLYSGNNSEAIFYYDERDSGRIPPAARRLTYYYPNTREQFVLIDNWVIDELEAPFYPEERYFRRVGAWLCGHLSDTSKGGIRIAVKEKFSSSESLKECRCGELP